MIYAGIAVLSSTVTFHNSGVTSSVGIQVNDALGAPITTIDWGTIPTGSPVSHVVYLKNTGNVAETASMTSTLLSSDGSLSWDYSGASIAVGASVPVTFTLTMLLPAGSNFNFDITVTGTA